MNERDEVTDEIGVIEYILCESNNRVIHSLVHTDFFYSAECEMSFDNMTSGLSKAC